MRNSEKLIYASPDRKGYVSSPKQKSREKTATTNNKKCSNTHKKLLNILS